MKRREFLKASLAGFGAAYHLPTISYAKALNKKIGILYGSRYGSTKDASAWIALGMNGAGHVINFTENPDLVSFSYLVIGSGIYFGDIDTTLKIYLEKNAGMIRKKVIGVFVVCGGGIKGVAQRGYLTKLY